MYGNFSRKHSLYKNIFIVLLTAIANNAEFTLNEVKYFHQKLVFLKINEYFTVKFNVFIACIIVI